MLLTSFDADTYAAIFSVVGPACAAVGLPLGGSRPGSVNTTNTTSSASTPPTVTNTPNNVTVPVGNITASFTGDGSPRYHSGRAPYYIFASLGWLAWMMYELV